jgi:hypothetical protein
MLALGGGQGQLLLLHHQHQYHNTLASVQLLRCQVQILCEGKITILCCTYQWKLQELNPPFTSQVPFEQGAGRDACTSFWVSVRLSVTQERGARSLNAQSVDHVATS